MSVINIQLPISILVVCVSAVGQTRSRQNSNPTALALRHVTVVDVKTGRLLPDQMVLVDSGRIRDTGNDSSIRVPSGVRIIDATGKYLIPGLWDMHAHFTKKAAPMTGMPQYLAAGVTGVREMDSWMDCKPPMPEDGACLAEKRDRQRRLWLGIWWALASSPLAAFSSTARHLKAGREGNHLS